MVVLVEITGDVGMIVPMCVCTIISREISTMIAPESFTHDLVHRLQHTMHDDSTDNLKDDQ